MPPLILEGYVHVDPDYAIELWEYDKNGEPNLKSDVSGQILKHFKFDQGFKWTEATPKLRITIEEIE